MTNGSTLRVGVTGHRNLADPDAVALAVDHVLGRLTEETGASELVAVSSLAEGADRIVAAQVLSRGGRLVVHLPLDVEDYATDFADVASRKEFDDLLSEAESHTVVPHTSSREDAYERAGHAVLDDCDVLLALWDGEPGRGRGGTAELVSDARGKGRRVEVVTVKRTS